MRRAQRKWLLTCFVETWHDLSAPFVRWNENIVLFECVRRLESIIGGPPWFGLMCLYCTAKRFELWDIVQIRWQGGGLLCIVNKKYTYFLSFSPCCRRVFPSGPRCLENTGWRTSVRPPLSLPSKYDRDDFGTKRYLCMHTPVLGLNAVWLSLFYGYAELWHRCGGAICTFMKDKDITFISKWGQV